MSQILLFALRPDATTALGIYRRAVATCRHYKLRGSSIAADRLHVSLFGLGKYERQLAEIAGGLHRK